MRKVQFIAYQIKTSGKHGTIDKPKMTYPGMADPKKDMEARCGVMADAIAAAQEQFGMDHNATKIFVAPEFFFRGGRDGVYDIETASRLMGVMDRYLADPKYKNWIFVLGTVLAVMPESKPKEILNVALVRIGGRRVGGKVDSLCPDEGLLVMKEYVSSVDFFGKMYNKTAFYHGVKGGDSGSAMVMGEHTRVMPTAGARGTGNIKWVAPKWMVEKVTEDYNKKLIDENTKKKWLTPHDCYDKVGECSKTGEGGGTNFKLGGFSFVLEICLDHMQKRAYDTTTERVDIHIVTSCGMAVQYQMNNLKDGCFFIVDGMERGEDRVVLRRNEKNVISPKKTINMEDAGRWRRFMGPAKKLFEAGRGTVYLYPTVKIGS